MRRVMADSIGRTQSFVCSETIERSLKASAAAPAPLPPLNVIGGVLDGKELYVAPADAGGFAELLDLYRHAGTGSYALFTRAIFFENKATFSRVPDETKDGRKLARWDFRVGREDSKYVVAREGRQATVGYFGSVWADASSFDLVRLEWQTEEIPAELVTKAVAQSIDYGRATIADVSVILPTQSELTLLEFGRELRSATRYADCRSYVLKSNDKLVHLAVDAPAAAASAAGEPALPASLDIETTLDSPIDERGSAVNDPVTLRVTRDVKSGKTVLVPKGATATGRITLLSRQTYRVGDAWKTYYIVGIQLSSLQSGGQSFGLQANLEEVGPTTVLETFLPFSQHPRKWGSFEDVRDQLSFPKPRPGESILGVARAYVRVPKGLRMIWSTR